MKPFSTAVVARGTFAILNSGAAWAQEYSSFQNRVQAVDSYKAGISKPDQAKDGIPCQKLCGKNSKNASQQGTAL